MRFNVRTHHAAEARDAAIRQESGWLDKRFSLFERICLPTIVSQSHTEFELHVYFDALTPPAFLRRFDEMTSKCHVIKRKVCDYFDANLAEREIKAAIPSSAGFILTTRLDNDDGLHRDFVKSVQQNVRLGTYEAINFPNGIVLADDALYSSKQESNAFISLFEPRETFKTVLQTSHNQLTKTFLVRDVIMPPMWLQHVHGGNVSNKIRGRRLMREGVPDGFEAIGLKNLIRPVGRVSTTLENITSGSARSGRDALAKLLRRARGG